MEAVPPVERGRRLRRPDGAAAASTPPSPPQAGPLGAARSPIGWWRTFPRNPRILIATEPAWSVFVAYWGLYMPLYLTHLGAGPALIGWIATWGYGLQTAGSLVGGGLARRFRRIHIVNVGDFLTWIVPLALWAALPDLWVAVAAQLATVSCWTVVPAWNALLLEDADPSQRPQLMNLWQLAVYAPVVCLPVLAGLIRRDGIAAVSRGVFVFTLATISASWLIRALTVKDTAVADQARAAQNAAPARDDYGPVLAGVVRPRALALLALGFCATARTILWTTYLPLFLVDPSGLRLSGAEIVLLPAVGAVAAVAAGLIAIPHVGREHPVAALAVGQAGTLAASVLIAAAPPGHRLLVAAAWMLSAAAGAAVFPTQAGIWYNLFPRERYTALQAVTGAISSLLVLPVGPLAGLLFAIHPRLPFYANAALQAAGLLLAVALWRWPPRSAPSNAQ